MRLISRDYYDREKNRTEKHEESEDEIDEVFRPVQEVQETINDE